MSPAFFFGAIMVRCNSFYLEPELWPRENGEQVRLKGGEARHMTTVLRSSPNQEVRLFDASGRDGLFRICKLRKNEAVLEALTLAEHPQPTEGVTLAIGWGKSKRRNYLFEKTVELHGLSLAFWTAKRSQGQMPEEPKISWREKCVQAAKQCGNPHVPDIFLLQGVEGLLQFARDFDQCYVAWEADEANSLLSPQDLAKGKNLVVIGPEGGLENEEVAALLNGGFSPVTLGDSILRWETAATYCLSLGFNARQEVK